MKNNVSCDSLFFIKQWEEKERKSKMIVLTVNQIREAIINSDINDIDIDKIIDKIIEQNNKHEKYNLKIMMEKNNE